jgi:PST family polysaccharide transporter
VPHSQADNLFSATSGASGVARRALRSFGWATTSFAVSRGLTLLSTLVLARLLSPHDFGVMGVGLAFVAFAEVALDLGVAAALIYEQGHGVDTRVRTAFTLNLVVALACTVIAVLAAPLLARATGTTDDVLLLRVMFCYLLFRGAGQAQDALLRRDMDFRKRALVEAVRAAVRAGVSIVLALQGMQAWALVLGLLAGEVAGTACCWFFVRILPAIRLELEVVRGLLRYGSAVLGMKVISAVGENADYFIVGHQLGPTQLGLYLIAFRLPELCLANLYWIFSSVAFPTYATVRAKEPSAFAALVLRALGLLTLFGFPVGVGLAIVSQDAVVVLFSQRWEGSGAPMALIALAMAVTSIGYASGDVLPAIGHPAALLKLSAPLTVLAVLGYLLAAPHGVVAVAAAHLAVSLTSAGVRLVVGNRMTGIRLSRSLGAMVPALATSAGVAAGALPVALLTGPGVGSLTATIACGAAGGLAALAVFSPAALRELRRLRLPDPHQG